MRAALAFLSLALIGGVAVAQSPAPPAAATAQQIQATAGTPAATKRSKKRVHRAQKGAAKPAAKASDDALSSCLGMWEPATHMTRRQWTHACRRVAERLREATLQ